MLIILPLTKLLLHDGLDTWHFVVLFENIWQWPKGRNLKSVDLTVTPCVVFLDVLKVCGFSESWVVLFLSC
jgi:hypothetical protein